jgi:hypothetical protein
MAVFSTSASEEVVSLIVASAAPPMIAEVATAKATITAMPAELVAPESSCLRVLILC